MEQAYFVVTDEDGFVKDTSRNFKQLLGIKQNLGTLDEMVKIDLLSPLLAPQELEAQGGLECAYLETELSMRKWKMAIRS